MKRSYTIAFLSMLSIPPAIYPMDEDVELRPKTEQQLQREAQAQKEAATRKERLNNLYYTRIPAELENGLMHLFQTKNFKEIDSDKIKNRALIAMTTSIITILLKALSCVFENKRPGQEFTLTGFSAIVKDFIEALSTFRIYNHAETIAQKNNADKSILKGISAKELITLQALFVLATSLEVSHDYNNYYNANFSTLSRTTSPYSNLEFLISILAGLYELYLTYEHYNI